MKTEEAKTEEVKPKEIKKEKAGVISLGEFMGSVDLPEFALPLLRNKLKKVGNKGLKVDYEKVKKEFLGV